VDLKFRKWTVFDFVIIPFFAAIGIAIKPFLVMVVHFISTPLGIPGGTLAGGLYMLWPMLARLFTGKTGSATLVGVLQALVVFFTGVPGSQGIITFLSYIIPCIIMDIIFIFKENLIACFFAGVFSNLSASLIVNAAFTLLPNSFLYLLILISSFSGGIGGILAYLITKAFKHKFYKSQ
jgi:energy-coupling factor transport system substrate-specific component